jgi:hypothetical protein
MRQAVAALMAAQALAVKEEASSRTPALPEPPPTRAARRRSTLLWAWLASAGKATHASG